MLPEPKTALCNAGDTFPMESLGGSWTAGRLLQAGIGTRGRSREQKPRRNRTGMVGDGLGTVAKQFPT